VKIDIRWQLLLAVICLGLVLSLLSYQIQTTGLCTTRIPSTGGRLGVGIVGRPDKINPLLSDSNPVDQELASLIFDGLMRYEDGRLAPALAEGWSASEDGMTVTFELREDVAWHDGQPVTAEDIVFTYGLLQSDEFPAPESIKSVWRSVVISPTGRTTVDFILPQPYGPFLDATTRGLLPAHLLSDVPIADIADHHFNQSPVGTGPFLVSQLVEWQQTGELRLEPDPEHWRRSVQIDTLDYRFYPDTNALATAFSSGDIQAISGIPSDAIREILSLSGVRLFSSPAPRMTQLLFNLRGSASPVVHTPEGRRALVLAIDRPYLIDAALSGQGLPLEGPYIPESWAYDSEAVFSNGFDPGAANTLLDDTGWPRAADSEMRQIDGEGLVVRLIMADEETNSLIAGILSEEWSAIGIETEVTFTNLDELMSALSAGDFDVALVEVEPQGDPDLYDFWSQEAIINGQNYSGWNNRRASEVLESGRQLYALEDRIPHYLSFLQYFIEDVPAVTLYQHVVTFALSESVQQAEIGRIDHPRERFDTLPDWFMLYREIAVACPEESA
jgi:peptide/nickel transport system substrate-binding protein